VELKGQPIPVAETRVCGQSLAEFVGSSPNGDGCL
jgi:hypothetical protein